MLADHPLLPIYFYVNKHMVKPRVQGWTDNVMNVQYSKALEACRRRLISPSQFAAAPDRQGLRTEGVFREHLQRSPTHDDNENERQWAGS